MEEEKKQERTVYLDFIRFYATVAVVMLHAAAGLLVQPYDKIDTHWWWIGNFYDSFVRPSVPLFVIISGALLLEKGEEKYGTFFKKRFIRVLIPFLFWSVIYFIYSNKYFDLQKYLIALLTGKIYIHLWFVYMILGLYLITPVLRKWLQNATDSDKSYFMIIWFFSAVIFPLFDKFADFKIALTIQFVAGYTGYFVLGSMLRKKNSSTSSLPLKEGGLRKIKDIPYLLKKLLFCHSEFISASKIEILKQVQNDILRGCHILIYLFLFFISFAVTVLGTYYMTLANKGHLDGYFYNYLSPNVFIMTVSMFMLIKSMSCFFKVANSPHLTSPTTKFLKLFGELSFGIYLMHPLVINILKSGILGLKLDVFSIHPLIGVPITTFACVFICFVILLIINKIPIIKYIV